MFKFWKNVTDLRKTSATLSGGCYSRDYAYKNLPVAMTRRVCDNGLWIPEPVEVALGDDGAVVCRSKGAGAAFGENRETFETSAGLFTSRNHGRFGGRLITPKGRIYGNFVEVFECGGKIYAVDSHEGDGATHLKICKFNRGLKPVRIFESKGPQNRLLDEEIAFKALYLRDDRAYLLASGTVRRKTKNRPCEALPRSYLLEIRKGQIEEKAVFDREFPLVNNMVIRNGKMFLGMDKTVAVADLETGSVTAYTPLGVEAEFNILRTNCEKTA